MHMIFKSRVMTNYTTNLLFNTVIDMLINKDIKGHNWEPLSFKTNISTVQDHFVLYEFLQYFRALLLCIQVFGFE